MKRLVLVAFLALLCMSALPVARGQAVPARPNVLILLTDDQRKDALATETKSISRLRAEGTEYSNAVALTPLCCPSRATIMSGQYPHNHATHNNSKEAVLRYNKANSLQADLHNAGYFTGITGKYFNGVLSNPPHFDKWATSIALSLWNKPFNVNGTQISTTGYATTFIRNKTLEFLDYFEKTNDSKPWFMFVGNKAPHTPAEPDNPYLSAWFPVWRDNAANREADLSDKPAYVLNTQRTLDSAKTLRRKQYRSLYSVDDSNMAFLNYLTQAGELENTIVIYTSDNGFMWHEHGLGEKMVPYEPALRVPLFVRYPGVFPAGVTDNRIVGLADLAPTIYNLTGITPEHTSDGKDLRTSARGKIMVEFYRNGPAIPSWRALWSPSETFVRYETGENEYYGPDDPLQLHNDFKDGIEGNEPTDTPLWNLLLDQQAVCEGSDCL